MELKRLITNGADSLDVKGVHAGFIPFALEAMLGASKASLLVVTPTEREAQNLVQDLGFAGVEACLIPWWGTVPYKAAGIRSSVFGQRAAALCGLAGGRHIAYVASQRLLQSFLPPPDYVRDLELRYKRGATIDPQRASQDLAARGYTRVPRVSVPGEYAIRGEVLDIYPPARGEALRIVYEWDRIEAIKQFDPETQSSFEEADSASIPPMKELIWDESLVAALEERARRLPELVKADLGFLAELFERGEAKGEEIWYPLAFENRYSVLDYLGTDGLAVFLEYERMRNASEGLEKEYEGLYKKARFEGPTPAPERLMARFEELDAHPCRKIRVLGLSGDRYDAALDLGSESPRSYFGNLPYFKEEIGRLVKAGYSVHLVADTEAQALRISELLKDLAITVHPGGCSAGFTLPGASLAVIHEEEVFGRKRRLPKSTKHAQSRVIDTFVELNPGDFVVHVNYGIGRFLGIERIRALGNERDYIKLEYADEETVFIPIEQVNLVQRYIGSEGSEPKLDRMGGKSWENRKGRARKAVEDLADRLVQLYSRRSQAQGFAFAKDGEWQLGFEAAFPFEETEDQLTCIAEVKADMESSRPMDRLLCGDVGYGKTEVAFRAIFKAVMSGKQAALLAPTTILAEQHFETAQDRFRDFPVRFAMLSRLVDKAEQRKILAAIERGEIDVVIGTHRILQKDVRFKDLGLMVVDEEQRFGVKDKERLKELKASVDCLTMTATPIPRTLHMSLLKIRDMSVLTTPPYNRQAVETVIEEFDDDLVARAVRAETARGGQVFFLHNRVESLDDTRLRLEALMPEIMVETAHGQMDPHELEDIMHRFIHGGFQVLVSTTIIENGIDIPNVNTIIIDRADMFGISQLYQLRGRVGRSDRKAYAYLLYPAGRAVSEIAMKRLQIISDFTELGSGFKIAMKDMEVRGVGNLLGREQSGEICAVGFDMYLRLLEEAVRERMGSEGEVEVEPYLELEYAGFIPDEYIGNPQSKMEVYQKIAGVSSREECERIYAELLDRFGPAPDEVMSLLALSEIRALARELSIASIKERQGIARVEFLKVSKISVEKVIRLMKEGGDKVRPDPSAPNVLIIKTGSIGLREKSEFLKEKLEMLIG
jgi:transcription-repair coupling factor (superfamily II helicase)